MGTMTGMDIANRAWTKVNEETGGTAVRWPSDEALDWINDAQREIVNLNHKAYTSAAPCRWQPAAGRSWWPAACRWPSRWWTFTR